ncbi:MAG: hypothetical protein HYV04_20345 [Deltaproteobacteria bacterium]|nr:hypothetical protein [Deltaproteobacteria bacterium]
MSDERILEYGREKGFHAQTLERWLSMAEPDREAIADLAQALKPSENHLRDFLDWLDEISLRDGVSPGKVLLSEPLVRIFSDPRLSRSDKLKRIKEEVRRLRFPRLSRIEDAFRGAVHEMGLSPQIQVAVPPGLEGGTVTVRLKSASYEELKRLVGELGRALETDSARRLFELLRGES